MKECISKTTIHTDTPNTIAIFQKPQRGRLGIRRGIWIAGETFIEILLGNAEKRQSSEGNSSGAAVVSSEPHERRLLGMTCRQLEALLDSFGQRQPMPVTRLRGANSKIILEDVTRRALFANTSAKTRHQKARVRT